MKEKTDEQINQEIDQMAAALLKNWSEIELGLDEDEDPEMQFKFWVIERLARAMVFASDINDRLPEIETRIEFLEQGRRRPGL
jgi:hypothetical protein